MPFTREDALTKFVFFYAKGSPFSQFYRCKFKVDEQPYTSAEQYMMHQKAVVFKDAEMAEKILESDSPPEIKKFGRQVRNFNDDEWNKVCFDVVMKGNKHKFSQNEEIKAELFATKGKTLVEASPRDRKWGIGLGENNPLAWDKSTWKGSNLLGYALTEVRDQLMDEEGSI